MNKLKQLPQAVKKKLNDLILKHPVMADLKGHDATDVMLLDILIWLHTEDPIFPPGPPVSK